MPNKRPITAEDLYELLLITDLQISPDGRHVIYTQQRVDSKTEKKYTNLWLVETDRGEPRQFTYGDQADVVARWSPDGRTIAFLSNRKDEKQMQLYLIPFGGGEARPLTNLKGSIGSFEWSPDGSRFVMMFRKQDADAIEREEDEQKKKLGVVARHITDIWYRADGQGYLPREKWHIWTVDATSGEAKQLTDGRWHETEPTWSPDGQQILFTSNRDAEPQLNIDEDELYVIPADGGEMMQVEAHDGSKFMARWSPDGRHIAYLGRPRKGGNWWQNTELYVVNAAGGEVRNLTAAHDFDISSHTLGDFGSPPPLTPPTWAADGRSIFVKIGRHGGDSIMRIGLDGSVEQVVDDGYVNAIFSFDDLEQKMAFFHAETDDPCQIRVLDMASGKTQPLTQVNRALLSGIALGTTEEVWIKGPDGNDLHGWILKPANFDASQKYPSILEIHGGPQTQYGRVFMHEFQYFAAQGYVVYYSNPRGGQGYGNEHAAAISNQWGTVDYADVMAWTDYVAGQPYIDTERMGITGGSYGGFLTTWIIGHTDRFKAAAPQRMVSNWISFHGTSDFNWGAKYLVGLEGEPWNNLEDYWRMSPMSHVGNITTPTLILHSEQDLRCDKEQGEQVFVALRMRGVDTELVLFPEENHGLSRSGRTDRRIARLNHILRWMDKYLKDEE